MTSLALIGQQMTGGRATLLSSLKAISVSPKNYSTGVTFRDDFDLNNVKRGRGGRSSYSGNTVTVFGASGYCGNYVVSKLAKNGTQVVLPYRCDPAIMMNFKVMGDLGQMYFIPFHDITDEAAIKKSMQYSNIVVNLIGREYPTKKFDLIRGNSEPARVIAKCAREMGVKKLIHVSALNCNQESESYLLPGGSKFYQGKLAGEQAVREEFPDAIIFRPSNIFGGNNDSFFRYFYTYYRMSLNISRFRLCLALPHGGRGVFKQPVYVQDFAQAIVNAIDIPEAPGKTYEIVGPRRYELRDLVEYLFEVMERDEDFRVGITDMKDSPFFKYFLADFVVGRLGQFVAKDVYSITKDKVERDSVTDEVLGLPNILDLGISNPTAIEDVADYLLYLTSMAYAHYNRERKVTPHGRYTNAL